MSEGSVKPVPYVLGIDTGGTYTDGVLLDFEGRTVVKKAKAFTTRQDLTIGIRECIDNLGEINPDEQSCPDPPPVLLGPCFFRDWKRF